MTKALKFGGLGLGAGLAVLFLAIQAVPYGRAHTNPPVGMEPNWDSQQTRQLAVRACYDCHSNETVWPLYSNVAPVSWFYNLLHPVARFSNAERAALIQGLEATFGTGEGEEREIFQDRTRLVTQLATCLEEHTRLQVQALPQVCDNVCDNQGLPIQAREQIMTPGGPLSFEGGFHLSPGH